MRGLMRMLMMFGPMIFRQFQKYQRNKQRQAPQQRGYNQGGQQQGQYGRQGHQGNQHQGNQYDRQGQQGNQEWNQQQGNQYDNRQGNQRQSPIQDSQPRQQYKDLNAELKAQGKGSEKMQQQEDFNLKESEIMLTKEELRHAELEALTNKAKVPNPKDSDFDIEDIFLGKGK